MALPAIGQVIPQAGTMQLLDEILEHDSTGTTCAVQIRPGATFCDAEGAVPAWVALEYMAQCAAAHGGLLARARGRPPAIGFLLGSRSLRLHADSFAPGERLRVFARHLRGERGLVRFTCEVREAESQALRAEAELNIYVREEGELGS